MSKPRKKRLNTVSQAIQLLNEQINEVRNDSTVSKQEKARTIGYLMGQWAKLKNITEESSRGQQQMDALTGAINQSVQAFSGVFTYDGQSRIDFGRERELSEDTRESQADPSHDQATQTEGGLSSNHTNRVF